MGIGGDSVLVPWGPAFWNRIAAEVVCVLGAMTTVADTMRYMAIGNATRA